MKKSTQVILLITNGVCYFCTILGSYLHFYYYNLMQEVFHLTNTQIGVYGGICGGVAIVSYIVGGLISDKFRPKTLLLATYASQMVILGLYMLLPPYRLLLLIQVFSVLSCIGLYWSAMSKYVRSLGPPEQESRLYGLHFSCVGLGGTVLTLINAYFISVYNGATALRLIFLLCIVILGISIIIDAILYKPEATKTPEEDKFNLSDIFVILKNPVFWLICFMFLGTFHIAGAVTYFSPLLYANYGVPLAAVSILASFRSCFARLVCAPIGGWAMHKMGSSIRFMAIVTVAGILSVAGILIVPHSSAYIIVSILIFAVLVISNNLIVPAWFTPVSEIGIPSKMHGTAVGLYCAVGFSSDCYLYMLGGHWLDRYGENLGYTCIFSFILIMLLVGFVGAMASLFAIKKQKAKIDQALERSENMCLR